MQRKIRLSNSIVLFIGIIFFSLGIIFGFFEYFKSKKEYAFSEMNILLYESEIPQNINSTEDIPTEIVEEPSAPPTEVPNNTKPEISYNYIGILEIPKINLKRGFLDLDSRYNKVDYNITVINGSTFPTTQNNNLILAAHSGACSICFFDKLYKLSIDDYAYIYYQNIKYNYKIVNIYEVEKDGTVPIHRDYSKNTLTLITCTRNSNTKQTVYILELVNSENY